MPMIGDDVWIAHDVFIKRGVTIGTGAVIGARSIVTKDVPPYAIVAGSPAIIKKYRFDEKTIKRLLASKWWDYAFTDFRGLNTLNPNEFLDGFEKRVDQGEVKPMKAALIDIEKEFIALA